MGVECRAEDAVFDSGDDVNFRVEVGGAVSPRVTVTFVGSIAHVGAIATDEVTIVGEMLHERVTVPL